MRCLSLLAMILTLVGCVASTEVKVASSEVGVALDGLRGARADLARVLSAEVEEIRQLVARSILSEAVNRRVAVLVNEGFEGDLIQLSRSIKSERDAAQSRINIIIGQPPPEGKNPDYTQFVIGTLTAALADGLRRTAEQIGSEDPRRAAALRAQADQITDDLSAVISTDEILALSQLILLESVKRTVAESLNDLSDYVKFLQLIHKEVNEWVTTDVTVKGEELAALIDKHAGVIGRGVDQ